MRLGLVSDWAKSVNYWLTTMGAENPARKGKETWRLDVVSDWAKAVHYWLTTMGAANPKEKGRKRERQNSAEGANLCVRSTIMSMLVYTRPMANGQNSAEGAKLFFGSDVSMNMAAGAPRAAAESTVGLTLGVARVSARRPAPQPSQP